MKVKIEKTLTFCEYMNKISRWMDWKWTNGKYLYPTEFFLFLLSTLPLFYRCYTTYHSTPKLTTFHPLPAFPSLPLHINPSFIHPSLLPCCQDKVRKLAVSVAWISPLCKFYTTTWLTGSFGFPVIVMDREEWGGGWLEEGFQGKEWHEMEGVERFKVVI